MVSAHLTEAVAVAVLAVVAGAAGATPPPPQPADPWSPTVDGLRGRLIVTPYQDASHRAQVKLEVELDNVSDHAEPLAFAMAMPSQVVELVLEDAAGKPLDHDAVGGNEIAMPPYALRLPLASTLRMTLSPAAYEYVARATMLRPYALTAWDIPARHGPLFLRAIVKPLPSNVAGDRAWTGPLQLPRVALP